MKNAKEYVCIFCDFSSSKHSNLLKHFLTLKHKRLTFPNPKNAVKDYYECRCGKKYKHASTLSTHRKKCQKTDEIGKNGEVEELKELVVKLMTENTEIKKTMIKENVKLQKQNIELQKQNQNIQKQVLDVCKNIQPSITNSNNNNNNKTFNLQFFLNEQCKDAMNISDFINSVTLSLDDLENIGSLGYVNGISSIIIKQLKGLDITKRPVHCSDAKRETLYVKDEDRWEKECPNNTKMKKAIKNVETKNIKLINEWTDKHPNFINSTSRENDDYLKIMKETMGGKGDYEENKNKIIKRIAKEVIIDK